MKKKKKFSLSQTVIYLVLSAWALTTIYPIIWVIINSFKVRGKILSDSFSIPMGEDFTLANYKRAFEHMDILKAYEHSLIISVTVAAVVVVLAGMLAYGMARYQFKGRSFFYGLIIAAMMFPVYATIIPVYRMEFKWGIVATGKVSLDLLATILPQIAGNLAFATIVLMGYIRGLPIELEEAAYMEGYNAYQIFFKIIMPLTKPSFATVAIFSFLWSYNDLFTQSFFLRTQNNRTITRLLNEITSLEGTNYGLMAASVVLVVVPVLIVYVFLQKYIIKGMTAGAVKG